MVAQHQQAFLEGILGEQNDWPNMRAYAKKASKAGCCCR